MSLASTRTGTVTTGTVHGTVIGGPTALLEYAGLRILTDPTFDPPGGEYNRSGVPLHKTRGPARQPAELGVIDLALVSHDQHDDNLDPSGRALLDRIPLTVTTPAGAARIGGSAVGLRPFAGLDLAAPGALPRGGPAARPGWLQLTAVPAQHGPDGIEPISGPVTGFVLRAPGWPSLYVSGDNASLDVVQEIADRSGPIDLAVLFAGAARPRPEFEATFTITSREAAEAARILGAAVVLPLHYEGWRHFTEGADSLRDAFAEAGLGEQLLLPEPGVRQQVWPGPASR